MKRKWICLLTLFLLMILAGCGASPQETEEKTQPESTRRTEEETVPTAAPVIISPQITERWMSGDLSDLAGLLQPETEDPEEAARLQKVRDAFAVFDEETEPEPAEDEGLLDLLLPFARVTLPKITADDSFPLEVPMTVTTPDVSAILTSLHYEEYEDGAKLAEDLAAVLKKGGFPERTAEVTVTIEKDGESWRAAENREAYIAFYGGLAELYMQEYMNWLGAIGDTLGGQE